jgi:hypothetical protein
MGGANHSTVIDSQSDCSLLFGVYILSCFDVHDEIQLCDWAKKKNLTNLECQTAVMQGLLFLGQSQSHIPP